MADSMRLRKISPTDSAETVIRSRPFFKTYRNFSLTGSENLLYIAIRL